MKSAGEVDGGVEGILDVDVEVRCDSLEEWYVRVDGFDVDAVREESRSRAEPDALFGVFAAEQRAEVRCRYEDFPVAHGHAGFASGAVEHARRAVGVCLRGDARGAYGEVHGAHPVEVVAGWDTDEHLKSGDARFALDNFFVFGGVGDTRDVAGIAEGTEDVAVEPCEHGFYGGHGVRAGDDDAPGSKDEEDDFARRIERRVREEVDGEGGACGEFADDADEVDGEGAFHAGDEVLYGEVSKFTVGTARLKMLTYISAARLDSEMDLRRCRRRFRRRRDSAVVPGSLSRSVAAVNFEQLYSKKTAASRWRAGRVLSDILKVDTTLSMVNDGVSDGIACLDFLLRPQMIPGIEGEGRVWHPPDPPAWSGSISSRFIMGRASGRR